LIHPFGWFHYNVTGGAWNWLPGLSVTYQGPLFSIPGTGILSLPQSIPGTYVFYFGIDMAVSGSIDFDRLYYDSVQVDVK
jgi:hypothetical protein